MPIPHTDEVTPAEHMADTGRRTSILAGSMLLGASSAVHLIASLLVSVLVSRALGPEGKGQLALLQQFPGIAALILGLGFGGANAYFVGRSKSTETDALSDSLAFAAIASLVGVPVTILGMRAFVPALDAVAPWVLFVAALTIPFVITAGLVTGILVGQGRIRGQAIAQITSAVISLSLVAAWYVSGGLGLGGVAVASLVSVSAMAAVSIAQTRVRGLAQPSIDRMKERWDYARRSYITSITGYLEMRQDVLLLGVLSSAEGVGIYSVAASVAELLWYVPQITTAPLMSRALQENADAGAVLTASVTRLIAALMVAASVVLAFALRPLIGLVFGSAFEPAATVFFVLAPGIIAVGVSSQLQTYLAAHGRLYPAMTTSMLLLNFTLNIATIPRFGYYGAAAATTVSYALGGGYILHKFIVHSGMRPTDVLVLRRDDIALVASAATALRHRIGRR